MDGVVWCLHQMPDVREVLAVPRVLWLSDSGTPTASGHVHVLHKKRQCRGRETSRPDPCHLYIDGWRMGGGGRLHMYMVFSLSALRPERLKGGI